MKRFKDWFNRNQYKIYIWGLLILFISYVVIAITYTSNQEERKQIHLKELENTMRNYDSGRVELIKKLHYLQGYDDGFEDGVRMKRFMQIKK